MDIQKMSIEEKIAGLSGIDKAYVMGYVDRALRNTKPLEKKKKEKKKKDNDAAGYDEESELEYEHEEGRYDGEI